MQLMLDMLITRDGVALGSEHIICM